MILQEGSYENLITEEIQNDIVIAESNGLVCKKDDIDIAESSSMLAEHIHRIVSNRLSDENLSIEERVNFVNGLMDFIGEQQDDKIVEDRQMLSAVVSEQRNVQLQATGQELVRPLTGFRVSNLFTGGQSDLSMNTEIERDIESADNREAYKLTYLNF